MVIRTLSCVRMLGTRSLETYTLIPAPFERAVWWTFVSSRCFGFINDGEPCEAKRRQRSRDQELWKLPGGGGEQVFVAGMQSMGGMGIQGHLCPCGYSDDLGRQDKNLTYTILVVFYTFPLRGLCHSEASAWTQLIHQRAYLLFQSGAAGEPPKGSFTWNLAWKASNPSTAASPWRGFRWACFASVVGWWLDAWTAQLPL